MMHQVVTVCALVIGGIATVSGCSSSPSHSEQLDAPPPPPREVNHFALHASRGVDLLFLVDNSPSMADKQRNLGHGAARLLDALAGLPGGLPDLHVGVVTSDVGSRGAADDFDGPPIGQIGTGGCRGTGDAGALRVFGAPITGAPFLSDVAGPGGARVRNYTGALADAVAQMTSAGSTGCGFEQSLEAIRRALDPSTAGNAGFLRKDAVLAVVILSDEDDCSLAHSALLSSDVAQVGPLQSFRCTRFGIVCDQNGQTPDAMNEIGVKSGCHPNDNSPYLTRVADYAQFLSQLKPDPDQLVLAAIAGTTDVVATELRAPPGSTTKIPALAHACAYNGDGGVETADPPVRIQALLDQFPGHSTSVSICQQDLSSGVLRVGARIKAAVTGSCITGKVAIAGAAPDCEISVTGADDQPATTLPRCAVDGAIAGAPACWHLVVDADTCPDGDHVWVAIEGQDQLASDAQVTASCAIEPAR